MLNLADVSDVCIFQIKDSDSMKRKQKLRKKRCKTWINISDTFSRPLVPPEACWRSAAHWVLLGWWEACTLFSINGQSVSRNWILTTPRVHHAPSSLQSHAREWLSAGWYSVKEKTDVCSSCQVPFLHFRNHSTRTGRFLLISFRWWLSALHHVGPPSPAFLLKWTLVAIYPSHGRCGI